MISEFFRVFLTQPLFNALIFLYQTVALQDLGLATIYLTIIVRVVLYPLFHKTAKHQRIAQQLQPELKSIRDKHKNDREKQTKAIMELYQKNQVNPITPFFLLLLQLPILFALYRLFINGVTEESLSSLYSFVSIPENISQTLFGLMSLTEPHTVTVLIAAVAQYLQGRLAMARMPNQKKQDQAVKIAKTMTIVVPFIAVVILIRLPAAVALYWLTSTIFSIIQQATVNKSVHKKDTNDTGIADKSTKNDGADGV